MRVRYDAHLLSLSLCYGENSRSILAGAVLPTLHSQVIIKNWHLCGVCWEDSDHKNLHGSPPPEVATNITALIKVAPGECQDCLQSSGERPSPSPNPQASMVLTSKGNSSQWLWLEAKQQFIGKSNISKTRIYNTSVELDPQPENTIKSSASTSSPDLFTTLYLTQGPVKVIPIPDLAYPSLITGPALRYTTPQAWTYQPQLLTSRPNKPRNLPRLRTQAKQRKFWS